MQNTFNILKKRSLKTLAVVVWLAVLAFFLMTPVLADDESSTVTGTPSAAQTTATNEAKPDLVVETKDTSAVYFTVKNIDTGFKNDPKAMELLKWLEITIKLDDGTVLYKGLCNALPSPVLNSVKIATQKNRMIYVDIYFLKEAPNSVQGANFNLIWNFAVKSALGGTLGVSDKQFYFNPNINPGDRFGYSIMLKNSGTLSEPVSTTSTTEMPSDPVPLTVTSKGGGGGGGTTIGDDITPLGDKTGAFIKMAADSAAPIIIVISLIIIVCALVIMLLPIVKRKKNSEQ